MVAIQSQILTRTLAALAPAPLSPRSQGKAETGVFASQSAARQDAVELSAAARTAQDPDAPTGTDGEPLSQDQQRELDELKKRDAAVRAHEQAHAAAAGPYFKGGPTYETQRGPDGKEYAVGGSVQIDSNPVPNDPQATIAKMQQVRRAALAPADPSAQDRKVAARASQLEAKARQELTQENGSDEPAQSANTETESDVARSSQPKEDDPQSLDLGYKPNGTVEKLQIENRIDVAA